MFTIVLAALILLNEVTRRWKWAGIAFFVVLPIVLTIFVWPNTAVEGSSAGTWFHWAKTYSALAGALGFMAIRYIPRLSTNKWALMFPPFILALNISEAVLRDFEISGLQGFHDGVFMVGGAWNIMNGIAGIINIITICGWMGIVISRDSSKDMVWPDMMWFWIIAYDIWNFAFVYNSVGSHSFYAGAALLISCTIPAFFIKRGAWLQHRANTLALWMIFRMTYPEFATTSQYAVDSTYEPSALFTVSLISLLVNLAVLVYQVRTIIVRRRNPLTQELYENLPGYQRALREAGYSESSSSEADGSDSKPVPVG